MKSPFYPIVFAIYPALYLYAENFDRMQLGDVLIPALVCVLGALLFLAISRLLLKDFYRASIFTFVFLCGWFTYQPGVRLLVRTKFLPRGAEGHDTYLVCLGVALLVIGLCLRFIPPLPKWITSFFNRCSLLLLVVVSINILYEAFTEDEGLVKLNPGTITEQVTLHQPNIYYVMLDGYGRADTLQQLYSYDNTPFLSELEKRGFYIARKSLSNYVQTLLSLSSTLNLSYINEAIARFDKKPTNRAPLTQLVKESFLVSTLKKFGYHFVAFSSGYSGTDMIEPDIRLRAPYALTEYEHLILTLSPLPQLLRRVPYEPLRAWQLDSHRHRVQFILNSIDSAGNSVTPRFVFAHVLSPHPPFVFGPNGESLNPKGGFSLTDGSHFRGTHDEYVNGYRGQVQYLNTLIVQAVDKLIAQDPEAIIVLQGDHGPGSELDWRSLEASNLPERTRILNAYRVPQVIRSQLYETITPVNSFRLILNYLSGASLQLLPDVTYFSTWPRPYRFINVTDKVSDNRR